MSAVTNPIDEIPHYEARRPSARGEPSWDVATFFPAQGFWSEEEYLALGTNHLVEYDHGSIEVLPMPTWWHQQIVRFLYHRVYDHVQPRGLGDVLFAPLPVRLGLRKYREPDVVFLSTDRVRLIQTVPVGADLAIEVVSEGPDARRRDLQTKRVEYAAAGIAEYWIVDPELREITVLTLDGAEYRVHGVFRGNDIATSVLLAEFAVRAADVFGVGERPAAQ